MALAPLGFTVDTGPVAKAVADLGNLTSATAKAQAGTKSLTAPTTAAANATKQLGAASAAAAAQMTIATNAVKANNAALAVTNQMTGAAQMQMRNLAFQFQDIGTMLIAGQSPFMLLAQQLPQVTMYGGQLNGVMGALKSTLAGLFSPLGLLTTGFVLAGSAAISYFSDTDESAKKAEKALREQEDLIQRVADEWGHAMPALKAYSDELARMQSIAQRTAASQAAINNSIADARAAYDELRAVFADFRTQAETGGGFFDIEQASAAAVIALDDFADAMRDGELSAQEYQSVNEALSDVLSLDVVQANADVAKAIEGVIARLMAGAQAARAYAEELAAVNAGGPIGGEGVAGGKGNRTGAPPLGDIDFASRFGWDEYFNFPRERKPSRRRKTDAERSAERYDDMIRQSQQFIAAQRLEQEALFMTEEAANALRYEQELLNQAANDNIKLTPEMAAELRDLAGDMAATEAETSRLQDALKFGKDLVGGFISDLRSGLEQGKGFWRSFGDAAMNVLDKIVDKLLNNVIDALFQVNSTAAGVGGGGGGLLGGILGGIGKLFGFARGGYTGNGPVSAAAGVVHGQEYVFSAAATKAIGVSNLDAIHNAARGYRNGGYVQPVQRMQAPANDQRVHVTVGVSVDDDGKIRTYVQKISQQSAAQAEARAVDTSRRSMDGWNFQLAQEGSLI